MKYILIYLFLICAVIHGKNMPKYIKPCSKEDPNLDQCFMDNGNLALKYIGQGDSNYGFRSFYPLKWLDILNINTPINPEFTLTLKNVTVYGFDNFEIVNPKIDLKKGNIKFTLLNPLVTWKEYYIASLDKDGDVEDTQGPGEINFLDGAYNINWDFDYYYINGIKYANITNDTVQFVNYTMNFDLDNLGSNKNISNALEEAKDYMVNDSMLQKCGDVISSYINGIFNNVPFDLIFT